MSWVALLLTADGGNEVGMHNWKRLLPVHCGFRALLCLGTLLFGSIWAFAQAEKPELVVQMGHAAFVSAIAFSPDGQLVVTASWDKTIKLWDVATRRELRSFEGHTGFVLAVAFSPNGKLLASGGSDTLVKIWDVEKGHEVRTIDGHKGDIRTLAFDIDGTRLAVGGDIPNGSSKAAEIDDTMEIFDVATGRVLRKLDTFRVMVSTLAFSPDGRWFAAAGFLYPERQHSVRIWEVSKWKSKRTFASRPKSITSIAFSPDGRSLASAGRDGAIQIGDVETGREIRSLTGHTKGVMVIAFSPDGRMIASGGEDKTVKLWDVATGQEIRTLSDFAGIGAEGNHALAFNPNGRLLAWASPGSEVKLWNVLTKQEIGTLSSQTSSLSKAFYSNSGSRLLTLGKGFVSLWDVSSGQLMRRVSRNVPQLSSTAVSNDGQRLAVSNKDASLSVVDVATGRDIISLVGHARTRSSGTENYVTAIAFSKDGRLLATSDGDVIIKIWDLATGREIQSLQGHKMIGGSSVSNYANLLTFSPDGQKVAAGKWNSTVEVWDVSSGRKLMNLSVQDKFGFTSVSFSPDGRLLASGGSPFDPTVKLWSSETGDLVRTFEGHTQRITGITFSHDGRLLATSSGDKTVRLWDVATGTPIRSLSEHPGEVTFVCFSPNDQLLIAGSANSLYLWNLSTGELLGTLALLNNKSDWLVATPGGLFDGSPKAWSQFLWRFSARVFDVAPVEIFFNEFYYPGLLSELLAGRLPQPPRNFSGRDRRQCELKMTFSDDTSPSTARLKRVKIEITAAAPDKDHSTVGGARDVRLFRNGSLVKVWHGNLEFNNGKVTLEALIPIVAGENHLSAYAFNQDNVKSEDVTLAVTGPDGLRRQGTAYVLAVGVNSYANREYNLKYAVADATIFGEEFRRQQLNLGRFSNVEVVPLLDKDATKANLLLALRRLAGVDGGPSPGAPPMLQRLHATQPEDVVVVYFAGHGTAQQNRFFLVPHDLGYQGSRTQLDRSALDTILAHSISDEELEQAFEHVDAAQIIFIIDACNSGQALEAEEKRRGPMNSKGLAQLAYEKGMYILTAAQSYQAALETPQHGHGYLTYALIEEGLKTASADVDPRDGQVTAREWLDYGTQRVPQLQAEDARRPKQNLPTKPEKSARPQPQRTTRQQRGRQGSKKKQQQETDEARQLDREKSQVTPQGPSEEKVLQQPRVFYRREAEPTPLVVARPN